MAGERVAYHDPACSITATGHRRVDLPLWDEGASPWPHEREALAHVRSRLPDHEPWRAWSNVEFLAEDGSVNEVDLLVISPKGCSWWRSLSEKDVRTRVATRFPDAVPLPPAPS